MENFLSIPQKAQGNLRVRKGHAIHHSCHGVAFYNILFQELHAGRGVIKQVPHNKSRPRSAASVFRLRSLSALNGITGPGQILLGAGHHLYPGHRCYGSQSFASEPQSADFLQILLLLDFAGGMPQKGVLNVLPGDAAAVIRHPHIGDAAPLDLNCNCGGTGIYGIFHHFLYNRGGAFHHLASGNQFRHMLI